MKQRSWILSNLLATSALLLEANHLAAQSGVLQFVTAAYTVKESTPLVKIIATRQGGSAGTVTVDFATMDTGGGNASPGEDYYPTNGTLTFGPGVTSRFFYLGVINDAEHEMNETVLLQLSNPSLEGGLGERASTTVTITDNDPCVYSLAPANRTHGEDGDVASFHVSAAEGCPWLAEESEAWIGIITGNGPGAGEVTYAYDGLPEGISTRTGTIHVAGKTFTITQTRPSPFTNFAGIYTGLLTEDPTLHHASSGSISLKLGVLGTFSAKISLGGKRSAFSGRFGFDGQATNSIVSGEQTISIVLALDFGVESGEITGTATGGSWMSSILAFRDVFDAAHPAPEAGRYTLILPGHPEDAATEPGGDGFATIVIGADGTAKLSGTLGDGTKVSAKAPLSPDGSLAVYIPLSGGRGSLLGWLEFEDTLDSDLAGTLTWFGPPRKGLRYPAGFATQTEATGSRYQAPSGGEGRVLSLTEGTVSFTAGNLAMPFSNSVQLSADGKATNLGTNKLVLTVKPATGVFTGTVAVPEATRTIHCKGVVHQKGNYGAGFFLGTDQTGQVGLNP